LPAFAFIFIFPFIFTFKFFTAALSRVSLPLDVLYPPRPSRKDSKSKKDFTFFSLSQQLEEYFYEYPFEVVHYFSEIFFSSSNF